MVSNISGRLFAAQRIDNERMPGSHEEKYSIFEGRRSDATATLVRPRNHTDCPLPNSDIQSGLRAQDFENGSMEAKFGVLVGRDALLSAGGPRQGTCSHSARGG